MLSRPPQVMASFTPGDPSSGYYNDLRIVADDYGEPHHAAGWLDLFLRRRELALPVTIVQLGLGAWQASADDARWLDVVRTTADWLALDMDGRGRIAYHQPMAHTYEIAAPWHSAMAQGQAASLLVRAATSLERPELLDDAVRAIAPLLDDDGASGLVYQTEDGPVLQEYPSSPPSHVLNGWVWALWGLYDVAVSGSDAPHAAAARAAFDEGTACLAARIDLYDTGRGWSRYDLYPHPVVHVASPFYHRLHIEQLCAMQLLAPHDAFARAIDRWQAGLNSRRARVEAVARKVGFRMLKPRRKAA